jgi:hypothetical protein
MSRLGVLTTLHRYQYRSICPKLLHLVNKNLWYPVYSKILLNGFMGFNGIYTWNIGNYYYTLSYDNYTPMFRIIFSIWVDAALFSFWDYEFTSEGLKNTNPFLVGHNCNLSFEPLYKYSSIPFLSLVLNELV